MITKARLYKIIAKLKSLLSKKYLLLINAVLLIALIYSYYYLVSANAVLNEEKIESTIARLNSKKKRNVELVLGLLTSLTNKRPNGIWLDNLTYQGKKDEVELNFRSLSMNDLYSYIYSIVNSNKSLKVLGASVIRKDYKPEKESNEEENKKQVKIAFVVDYLNKKNLDLEKDRLKEKNGKEKIEPVAEVEYTYESNVKLSVSN